MFCPTCGVATPTEISLATGTARTPLGETLTETEQRARVTRAIGDEFVLGRLLGRGGFAEVYAATESRLKRQVAIKVLRADLILSQDLSERFRREAEAVAKVRHPNIIPIYQVGEHEGLSYYVMPLVDGGTLRARMDQGPLPIAEAQRITREIASALAAAHAAGIVHRDIKPDNVMLEGGDARVVVTDFGIAKALSADDTALTGTGIIVGTPLYMSPEQAMGDKLVDARSDIYSLGVVAYQLFAGKPPFEGSNAQDVILKHISSAPRPLDAVRKDVPPDVSDAVMRCLRKSPADRWASAADFAAALLPPPPPKAGALAVLWRRIRPLSRRARVRASWYIAAFAVLLAVLVYVDPGIPREATTWWYFRVRRPHVSTAPSPTRVFTTVPHATVFRGINSFATSLASIGDTLLLVASPFGHPMSFDGTTWRALEIPVPYTVFPPVLFRGGLVVAGSERANVGPSILYQLTPRGVTPIDTISRLIESSWSDGRTLLFGTSDGGLLRGEPRHLRREPTGTQSRVVALWGNTEEQLGLGVFANSSSNRTDSLLTFNGLNWRLVDIRVDTSKIAVYNDGIRFRDGPVAVVGTSCERRKTGPQVCHSMTLMRDSPRAQWRAVAGVAARNLTLWGIWGATSSGYYVYGADTARKQCGPRAACVLAVSGDSVRAVDDLRGHFVIGMASLRGAPYALTDEGTLFTVRNGQWGIVGSVPAANLRGVAAGGRNDMTFAWGSGLVGSVPLRSRADVRAIAISRPATGDPVPWILSEGGRLSTVRGERGRRGASWSALEEDVRLPDSRRIAAVAANGEAVIVGGERGLVATHDGHEWKFELLPAGSESENVIAVAIAPDRSRFALTDRGVFRARAGDALAYWRATDPSVGRGRTIATRDSGVVVLGDRGAAYMGERRDVLLRPAITGTPTSVGVLRDGRIALGFASDDPLVGGALMISTPFESDSWPAWQRIDLPGRMSVYGLAADDSYLNVVGSGWTWIRFWYAWLPFAPPQPAARAPASKK